MRIARAILIGAALAAGSHLGVAAAHAAGAMPAGGAVPAAETAPPPARHDLRIPDDLWRELCAQVAHADRPLGYTAEEMEHYGRDLCRLRTVENLFRDLRDIPRFSGRLAENLVAAADHPAELISSAFLLTDVSAGRNLPLPDSSSWGVGWLRDDVPASSALDAVLAWHAPGTQGGAIAPPDRSAWYRLPEAVQRLIVRLFIGAAEATGWLQAAWDPAVLAAASAGGAGTAAAVDSLYRLAVAPWIDERLGQLATRRADALSLLHRVDREYLAFGSVIFFTHVERALREYRAAVAAAGATAPLTRADACACAFTTALGAVRIAGAGDDELHAPAFLAIDLGGDDLYRGRHGVPAGPHAPIALVLDLGGHDRYDGGDAPVALGCGLFGVGAVIDLAGDDRYRCRESGLGAAWYGTGLLMDCGGNDDYVITTHWGQGMAVAGAGLLVDLAGDDQYTCGYDAQGYGGTYGAGVLLDLAGDDRYVARDDGNISALYLNQSVSMAQGVGQGRRADLGDGHSLAGGFGVLVDGAGDDLYHATAWSQGAGYWWSVGLLEDLGGDDSYRNGKYSLGAGAHFAIGCQTDLCGNDRYNVGHRGAVNQFQGHARDGSIGVSIDGAGDDSYRFHSHCGGSGDLGSIGFFWDRAGDDVYGIEYQAPGVPSGWNDTPPMGTTTRYEPFHSWRDDINVTGIFLDTGGADRYLWPGGPARNNHAWRTTRGARAWGVGLDRE